MKKSILAVMSALLSVTLVAGSALAAPKEDKEHGKKISAESQTEVKAKADAKAEGSASVTVTATTYGSTVTGDTYGKKHGLERAYENVKDKPAGKVIAELLKKKQGIDVTSSVYELTDAAAELEAQGEVTTAVDVQKEAVKLDAGNLELFKKLGKLLEKLGKKGVKAYVNGEEPNFEVAPFIKDGSTLVPFRAISESLKAEVAWDAETRTVTVVKNGITVKLIIGSTIATVDGKEVTLEVPGEIYDGSTMVPVRFISESLKAKVQWEAETQSVVITE
jgi:hypothetical protein